MQFAQTGKRELSQPLGRRVQVRHPLAEPGHKLLPIRHAAFAEAVVGANLRLVVAQGAFAPVCPQVDLGGNLHLAGDERDATGRHVLDPAGKAAVEGESLEQHREGEPGSAGLVRQQGALTGVEGPVLGKFVGMPVLLQDTLLR